MTKGFARRLNYILSVSAVVILLVPGACDETKDEKHEVSSRNPLPRSFEKDGEIVDEFVVSNTVLRIPQQYSVKSSQSTNLNMTAYWPGLHSGMSVDGVGFEGRVKLIFQPNMGAPSDEERDDALLRKVRGTNLRGPTWFEKLGLHVYQDEYDAPQLLVSKPLTEPAPNRHAITCLGGKGWRERQVECRVYYPLTDDLYLQYRFFTDLLPEWQALDTEVRSFALSLIHESRAIRASIREQYEHPNTSIANTRTRIRANTRTPIE